VSGRDATPAVSPQTQALSLYIRDAVERLQNSPAPGSADEQQAQSRLLFLGNWQDPYPRLLVTDPVLEPVDKLTWQIIRLHISSPGAVTAFPSYETICAYANIRSNHTVSRALAILRATRWLSLCARVRDKGGRYLGNIYVLHDEPVTLGDAMFLDGEYMAFLQQSRRHNHPRVRKVVESVLTTIEELIDAGGDVTGERIQTRSYERRMAVINRGQQKNSHSMTLTTRNDFYAVSPPQIEQLATQKPDTTDGDTSQVQILHTGETEETNPVQKTHTAQHPEKSHVQKMHMEENSKNDRVQNLHMAERSSCSSNNINTTTTCSSTPCARATSAKTLHFPPQISPNEQNLARMYLGGIDVEQQQDVLDEWHGRLHSASRRGNPIDNPIGYLASLCRRVKSGEFRITIGVRVRDAREREERRVAEEKRRAEREEKNRMEMLAAMEKQSGAELTGIGRRMEAIRKRHAARAKEAGNE